jgi:dTDP-4-dehydrorhamnose 3,5-epimerase
MKFTPTEIPGAYVIDIEPIADERGFFARTWARDEFSARGLNTNVVQCSLSANARKGTLRGMHYQIAPHEEAKLVSCPRGSIYDVLVDLRPDSSTFRRWLAVELSAGNRRMVYIPEGCAHGYLTLEDDCDVAYQVTADYAPACARGVRWDDPAFAISWPLPPTIINARDANYPLVEVVG